MAKLTLGLAGLLAVLGLGFWGWTGEKTALIPVGPAVLFAILGGVALSPKLRMHAMHAAAALALLLVLAMAGMAGPKGLAWLGGTEPERPAAVVEQLLLGLFCLVYVALAVRSFIAARRARRAGA